MEEKESVFDDVLPQNSRSFDTNLCRKRAVSLSDLQAFFLHALLIDEERPDNHNNTGLPTKKYPNDEQLFTTKGCANQGDPSERRLNSEMLFNIPISTSSTDESNRTKKVKKRRSLLLGLWRSHEKGIHPRVLIKRASTEKGFERMDSDIALKTSGSMYSFDSDEEVRNEKKRKDDIDELTESSSIEDEAVPDHYNSWEVLRDEYAADFGFSYSRKNILSLVDDSNGDQITYNTFSILGTSANDKSVQPHVLSPPLMDAIMTFLPEKLHCQNFWLRYSLMRDGANFETMLRYIHPCKYTIIAIETTKGEVFGSFTSFPWRTNLGFFGQIPAFVWKMRYNRRTKCASLYEQAQLESIIDVYMNTDRTQRIQVCQQRGFAVGGDETMPNMDDFDDSHDAFIASERSGFAIAVFDESLTCGTTSQSSTFRSPSLVGPGDRTEIYTIAGLEVWTLTPAFDVDSAKKMEMSKYFIEESVSRDASRNNSSRNNSSRSNSNRSNEISQDLFYRRIGDDSETESRREEILFKEENSPKGLGRSPRFDSRG